jgi:exonuclease III
MKTLPYVRSGREVWSSYIEDIDLFRNFHMGIRAISKSLTRILLIRGNIELNPDPKIGTTPTEKAEMSKHIDIISFNCNGLADKQKLKRELGKANQTTTRGGIVMLQETHVTDESLIRQNYKGPFRLNVFKSNSAGIITLLSFDFEIIFIYSDEQGRQLHLVVERGEEKYLVVNVYCPNDHKQSIAFVEKVYNQILETINIYPDCYVILGGDFNSCLTELDYLNRNKLKPEDDLTKIITQNNKMCSLIDSFRYVDESPGYTWNRGTCYSRLDYLYVSNEITSRIKASKIDWADIIANGNVFCK